MKKHQKLKVLTVLALLTVGSVVFSQKVKAEQNDQLALSGNCVSNGVLYAFYTWCINGGKGCTATNCPAPPPK